MVLVVVVDGDVEKKGIIEKAKSRGLLDGPINNHVDDTPVGGTEVWEHVCDGVSDVHVLVEDGGPQIHGFGVGYATNNVDQVSAVVDVDFSCGHDNGSFKSVFGSTGRAERLKATCMWPSWG